MTTFVVYRTGSPKGSRILNASDLKAVGVEGFKHTEFVKNVPVEVEDEVAEKLTSAEIYGTFEVVDNPEENVENEDAAPTTRADKAAARKAAREEAAANAEAEAAAGGHPQQLDLPTGTS